MFTVAMKLMRTLLAAGMIVATMPPLGAVAVGAVLHGAHKVPPNFNHLPSTRAIGPKQKIWTP
jgi:hypothetical protein